MHTPKSCVLSEVVEDVSVVNALWQMHATNHLDIQKLSHVLRRAIKKEKGDVENVVKYFPGRPFMTIWRMMKGRTVQFFSTGKIQMIGKIPTRKLALKMRALIRWVLMRKWNKPTFITEPQLQNMVVKAKYRKPFKLSHIPTSDKYFYETEVFPAALISQWHPSHVAIFHSGSVLCTGIKDWTVYSDIILKLHSFLSSTS